jgi:RNA polymerase sigma-70 factor (ECF subfamily)
MDGFRTSVNDLAQACAHSADAAEWGELLRRSQPLVSLVAVRVARMWMKKASPAVVDDIVQEVFLKLCEQERRILRDFTPRGEDSFLGLLRLVSASVANDYFRRAHSAKRGGRVVTTQLGDDGQAAAPDARDSARMEKTGLVAQLDRRLREAPQAVGERDREIFWLYYFDGFTAEEIAGLPYIGLGAKGVESAVRRVGRWLRDEVKARPPNGEA